MIVKDYIITLLLLGLPVILSAVAHMIAVKFNLFGFLKIPLDLGMTYRDKRIFGENKTFRGIFLMVLFSIIFCYFFEFITVNFEKIDHYNLLYFDKYPPLFYGILYGLGYTLSELPNSFYKRQINVPPGKRGNIFNVLIDQVDSVIGCLFLLLPFSELSLEMIMAGVLFFASIHLLINFVLFLSGVRENPL